MTRQRLLGFAHALVVASLMLGFASAAEAQSSSESLQTEVAASVLDKGWWDETGALPSKEMQAIVEQWGEGFAFAYTDRSFEVSSDPALSAAALLAQSTLETLALADGPQTVLFVSGDGASGASNHYPYPNIVMAMSAFDTSDVIGSFEAAAEGISERGSTVAAQPVVESGFFDGVGLFVLLGGITSLLAAASFRTSRRKTKRQVHTADAKVDTKTQIQQMSDLILDLEPRITIANDPDLRERYATASKTYSEVLERADTVDSGHDVADLRIEIAQARWKLDVIDAELDGRPPPKEPFHRDVSGSAWDSTRGSGEATSG